MPHARSIRPSQEDSDPGPQNLSLSIFLISVLGLFLELMLIRWIGTEVRIFAYLQNTVLIVCFLGLGMGCFACRKPIRLYRALASMFLLTTILALPFSRELAARITDLLSVLNDLVIWESAMAEGRGTTIMRVTLGLGLTLSLMVLLWEIFFPLGQILGRKMDQHPHTIRAYSINVAGSLIGIFLFAGLSAFCLPPVIWFCVAAALIVPFIIPGQRQIVNCGLVVGAILMGWIASQEPEALEIVWSPYQKLVLKDNRQAASKWCGQYLITVNNAGYQGIIDLSNEAVERNDNIPADVKGLSQYDIPFLLHSAPRRALLVGAGSGNDAAGGLRRGAEQVTAVEIDPVIIEMGRQYHPESPYADPRVTVVNDDARSFFASCDQKFDLIVFGLLDSHTTTAMTNARLDHYVYTRESIARAKTLLAEAGVMVLSFEAAKPFIADRMGACLREVFDQDPIVFRVPPNNTGWGGVMFVVGDRNGIARQLARQSELAQLIQKWQESSPVRLKHTSEIATDDWPYIYLEHRAIPTLYYLLAGLLLLLVAYAKYQLKVPVMGEKWKKVHWHFFFLGAAFLLLEVQNISKASVALGNTWSVNAVIISGILGMILLANVIVALFPRLPLKGIAACLVGSCVLLFFVDIARFAFLPYAIKAVVVGSFTTVPLLFAGMLFIRSFSIVQRKDLALGANLMGALVGGLLQSISFVTGVKALLLVVALCYVAALVLRPTEASRQDCQPENQWHDVPVDDGASEPDTEEVGEAVAV